MSKKIYVALSTFSQEGPEPLTALTVSGLAFDINTTGKRLNKEQVMALVKNYDGVVAGLEPYDAEVLKALSQLKCISRCGVGIDNVDLGVAKQSGITVLNTPQVVITPVAEMTLALIFDCLRQVTAQAMLMRQGKWERLTGLQLSGKTVGIIGLGRIGKRVAQMLLALGAHVMAYDLYIDYVWAKEHQVHVVTLTDLLKRADIVSLHLSGNQDNPLVLTTEHFSMMKKGSIIVNTARGQFIDEEALYTHLISGHIGGAGLDVFKQEPYVGPLSQLVNVVVTPHCSTLTKESRLAMEVEAVTNIIEFFKKP